MTTDSSATVYAFMSFEQSVENPSMAPFKATREAIVSRYLGRVLEGTAEQVETDALDPQGRYHRVATGWGELSL
jgi:hypothetical protein